MGLRMPAVGCRKEFNSQVDMRTPCYCAIPNLSLPKWPKQPFVIVTIVLTKAVRWLLLSLDRLADRKSDHDPS